jgi:hypothetical protein
MIVRTYVNLNRTKDLSKRIYSIQSRQKPTYGKVAGYSSNILLSNCKFFTSEKSRQRVLSSKNKNVHSAIQGTLVCQWEDEVPNSIKARFIDSVYISYDPYKTDSFKIIKEGHYLPEVCSDLLSINFAEAVLLTPDRIFALNTSVLEELI